MKKILAILSVALMIGCNGSNTKEPQASLSADPDSTFLPNGYDMTDIFKTRYCPLIEKLLLDYPIAEDRVRYFQHFKGNKYKLIASAFDSETQERMVVYQDLYGDRKYWVRPEKMFFEQIERNGKRFSRFQELDWEE